MLADAALLHDQNNYHQELDPDSDFTRTRREALDRFQQAATLYARKVPDLKLEEETAETFEMWFYASLGACDLSNIDEKKLLVASQPELIREAIQALPGEAAERHLAKFANSLFVRMSGLNPAVKHRYLKAGFEIVGDHEQAREARKIYDYYKDLVTEIQLDALIDGPDVVGHDRPFGLFVNLRHTREIERESGGFGRYLQNQNNTGFFYYNYGRPLENYRDKFEEAAREALKEQFEVLSVIFQDEKVNSRATPTYGWRYTPYAYILLKARSPKVDKVPPLRLDLDFLDTSGYVILPVESPTLPIDASSAPPARPFQKLQVTQTLDERQAGAGKLILEVKATAQGLVPDLDQFLDIRSEGFHVAKTDDQGISIERFDPDSPENVVLSERTWLVSLQADDGLPKPPEVFRFATATVDLDEMTHQRYVDADLAEVEPVVNLEQRVRRAEPGLDRLDAARGRRVGAPGPDRLASPPTRGEGGRGAVPHPGATHALHPPGPPPRRAPECRPQRLPAPGVGRIDPGSRTPLLRQPRPAGSRPPKDCRDVGSGMGLTPASGSVEPPQR